MPNGEPGLAGYRQVVLGLRCPRVAIVIPRDSMWMSHAAMALWVASRTWGGSGFTIVAANAETTPDVVLRALAAYDPDHVVGMSYTHGDLCDLGIHAQPANLDPDVIEMWRGSLASTTPSDDIAAGCNPYHSGRADTTFRTIQAIGTHREHRPLRTVELVPDLLDGLAFEPTRSYAFGLLYGLRFGFASKPVLLSPTTPTSEGVLDRGLLTVALSGQPTARAPGVIGTAFSSPNPDAWSATEADVDWVSRLVARPRRLLVVGDTVDDFALAVTWDRMNGHSSATWVHTDVLATSESREVVGNFLLSASLDLERHAGILTATSTSLTLDEVRSRIESALESPRLLADNVKIDFVDPNSVVFEPTHHLAFVPDDFDIRLTLPTVTDGDGSVQLASRIPARLPCAINVAPGMRPDWQVDVNPGPRPLPKGRSVRGLRLLVRENDWTVTRSSREGISFDPMDMGFVAAEANLRQSIAEPILRFPSLLEWTKTMIAPKYRLELSDAGRRAQVCADVIGTREDLLAVFPSIRPLLAEFVRPTSGDRDFREQDGLSVAGLGNALTLAGCARSLGCDSARAREILDRLLRVGVLRRGLVLRCGYCSGRDFYALDDLEQQYQCRRCANRSHLAERSWTEAMFEPDWYYSLHGTFRDLMNQNGDVPLLAAAHLTLRNQDYADLPEVDFLMSDGSGKPIEIDLISLSEGEVIVAEAKRSAASPRTPRSFSKLVHVAAGIQADTIMLASGTDDAWPSAHVEYLRNLIGKRRFVGGRRPRLVTLTGLYCSAVETRHEQVT